MIRSVCVYCGANFGADPAFADATRELARRLVARDIRLVYGGAAKGLMGVLADTALEAGGTVTGIIPQALVDMEIAHGGLEDLRVVGSMHERKALMAELSDAFVALPGGIGTLEELIEVYTWTQLGLHSKPLGVLNVNGFYDPLAAFLDGAVAARFLRAEHRAIMTVEAEVDALLDRLDSAVVPKVDKWL